MLNSKSLLLSVIAVIALLNITQGQLAAIDIGPMTWTPRADWINVKSCTGYSGCSNATGNGSADDTAALQSVLNYLQANPYGRISTVYFPAGTYLISSTLKYQNLYNLQFIGCGSNTIIRWTGASGSAMLWPNWSDGVRYMGLTWDGNNLAGCAYESVSALGGYETNIRHENESFKNFTVTGSYTYVGVDGKTVTDSVPGAAVISGLEDAQVSGETMFYNCAFSNCTYGLINAYQTFQNYMWHIDGCEFENCGNGIWMCNGGCFMVDNCHFQHSTGTDIIGGFSMRVRHCTSSGSNQFYLEGQDGSLSQDVFQDCWIDSWTGTNGPLVLGTYGSNTVFDCTFTNPPSGASGAVEEIQNNAEMILSNNYAPSFAGGTGLVWYARPSVIDFIPPGARVGLVSSATQTFLKTTWPADSTHIINVTSAPYNADPTFATDSTSAIQAAINAAQTANNGSIVYVPDGLYKISSTLTMNGSNYTLQGEGERSQICWYGPSTNTIMTIATPQNLTVQYIHFACLNNVPGTSGYQSSSPTCDPTTITGIKETSTGASSIIYDDFYYDAYTLGNIGATGDNSNGPGLVLSSLPAGSTVYIPHSYTTLTVQDCGAAQIFSKYLAIGEINVSGASAKTGFLGALVAEGGQQSNLSAYTIKLNDNQDLVLGDYYSEQSRNDVELLRGAGTGTGRVTIQGFVSSAGVNGNPGGLNAPTISINVNNYAGRLMYGPQSFGDNTNQSPVQITQTGTNPIDMIFAGDNFADGTPTVSLTAAANLIESEDTYLDSSNNLYYMPENPNPLTYASVLSIAQGLDHLRQLEAVDLAVEFGLTPDGPPVAAYPLENNANDMISTNNGTNHGATFVDGAVGSFAAEFNGTSQYIDLGSPSSFSTGRAARTIAGWGKSNSTAGGYRWIASYGTPSTDEAMFIGMNGTTLVAGGYGDDLQVNNFWDNNWHYIVLTYNGTTAYLYADGALVASGAKSWNLVADAAYIGKQVNGSEYWSGAIDQVQFYIYALNATEVASLYNHMDSQLPINTGLVAHWRLDESTGSTSVDTSGNAINGTWTNSPTFSTNIPLNTYNMQGPRFPDPGSLTFNGTNQYVTMGNPAALPSGTAARTICGWAKAGSTASGWGWIASFGSAGTDQAMFIGRNGTTLYGGGYADDLSVANFWDGNWHFIALTYDGTTANLYADGVLKTSGAKSWNLVHSACYIGEQVNNASEYWNGNVDDVRIYNRALSATEVAHLAAGNP